MEFKNSIISWLMKKRYHQIELFIKYPHEVQAEWFDSLVEKGTLTEWGKEHDYSKIKTSEDFKKAVPIQSYETLHSRIEEIMEGKPDVLWPGTVKWFAKSSGTTADKSKFIPVTKESLEDCHYKGGKDLISLYYIARPQSKLFTGKGLVLGGSSSVNKLNDNSYYGDLSAVIIRNLPFWAEHQRTPSIDVALMEEWEEKIQKMVEVTSEQDITSITGVPSWTLVLLKRVLEYTGKEYISKVWPNLELFAHGGVSFEPYKNNFEELFEGLNISYLETYNASEGFFGIQNVIGGEDNGLLLMLDYGIYYEFMPLGEIGSDQPETLSLHEVETGEQYALIISTNGGLWRYEIGDTIEFTSLNPFKVRVTGRTKHFINAFGEELIIENAEKALKIACETTGAQIKDYTAAPVFMSNSETGGHEWAIEFEKLPENRENFTRILDDELKACNTDYEAKRYKNFVLMLPKIHFLPSGTFYEWMKKRGKLGGQNKVPRLSNNRKYLEDVLSEVSVQ